MITIYSPHGNSSSASNPCNRMDCKLQVWLNIKAIFFSTDPEK